MVYERAFTVIFCVFQALLSNCGQATCDLCTESQIITEDGRAQLNASLRNRFVRGQTVPTNQSFLGTFFRAADINDKAALAYRGAEWGILAGDIECDREKVDDGVPLGSVPGGNCVTKDGTVTGNSFNNESRAYHNRWYLDQHRTPGTPLWPAGAKSEFGVCCAYQYATFGTNGYRATSPGAGTDVPFNEGGTLKGKNADAYNKRAASRGFRLTSPFVPEILRDRLAMCYRDGPEIRAHAPADYTINTPSKDRTADICRVGDPLVINVFENVSINDKRVANDAWSTLPVPGLDLASAASILRTKKGVEKNEVGDERSGKVSIAPGIEGVADGFFDGVGSPYKAGHASCTAIRKPKTGVSQYYNIDAQPWPDSQPILRSFVSPVHWHHPAEKCVKEIIPAVVYSNMDATDNQVFKCSAPPPQIYESAGSSGFVESPFTDSDYLNGNGDRWWKNMMWDRNDSLPPGCTYYTYDCIRPKIVISNTQQCQTWNRGDDGEPYRMNYNNRVVSAPVAGLLDILIAPKITAVGPFAISLQTVPAPLEIINADSTMAIQTIVRTNDPYSVHLTALVSDSDLVGKKPTFFMENRPEWITFDQATGTATGTAPQFPTTVSYQCTHTHTHTRFRTNTAGSRLPTQPCL